MPCPGITDPELQEYASLPLASEPQTTTYYLHVSYERREERMTCTSVIRAHACTMKLKEGDLCTPCKEAKRLVLRKQLRRQTGETTMLKKTAPLSRVSKSRITQALKVTRQENREMARQLQDIRRKLANDEQVQVSSGTHEGLKSIMDNCEKDDFTALFWREQLKAFNRSSGGMRWHPMMVRFAILVHTQSPTTYRTLKDTGVLKLPSESTLRDYTNVLHPSTGYRIEVFQELQAMCSSLSDNERWVCLLHDEVSIKCDLVHDKKTGDLVGFVDSPSQNEDTALATHALVFMVVGITANIKMSIGYFATRTATADMMFVQLWRAIGLLECVSNLKVIASTSDKAGPNQKLIKMHGTSGYKSQNLYAPDRDVYFFSDAPHLIKTVRNIMSNSGSGKATRHLWNNDQDILWAHVCQLYKDDSERQLRRTKLTAEHIYLNPQSSMRVYLAAQVLSNTVGSVMQTFGGEECQETAKFILLMDKFFDCLNSRSPTEGLTKNNKYLAPFTSVDDERFRFLSEEFWGYVENWREAVATREGYTKAEKQKMFLSQQTYDGLKTTVHSMIEATKYLLGCGVKMVLTNRYCQDPLEQHFGRHRSLGIRAENPSLWTYGYQENKLRLQRSLALTLLPKGNIRSKRADNPIINDNTPLRKIRRK